MTKAIENTILNDNKMNGAKDEEQIDVILKDINFKEKIREIKEVKADIQWLRCELNNFLTTFVYVSDDCSETKFANEVTQKLLVLRKALMDYIDRYNKLLPFIKLGRENMGLTVPKMHEVRMKPYLRQKVKAFATITQPKKPGKI